jgi:hypothetical protein
MYPSISLNGQSFAVTPNLFIALKHLRNAEEPRVLWIGAICINQEDIEERGKQVQIMSKIYSNAIRVLVWLGEEISTDPLTFVLLRRWHGRIHTQAECMDNSYSDMFKDPVTRLSAPGYQLPAISSRLACFA